MFILIRIIVCLDGEVGDYSRGERMWDVQLIFVSLIFFFFFFKGGERGLGGFGRVWYFSFLGNLTTIEKLHGTYKRKIVQFRISQRKCYGLETTQGWTIHSPCFYTWLWTLTINIITGDYNRLSKRLGLSR